MYHVSWYPKAADNLDFPTLCYIQIFGYIISYNFCQFHGLQDSKLRISYVYNNPVYLALTVNNLFDNYHMWQTKGLENHWGKLRHFYQHCGIHCQQISHFCHRVGIRCHWDPTSSTIVVFIANWDPTSATIVVFIATEIPLLPLLLWYSLPLRSHFYHHGAFYVLSLRSHFCHF